MRTANALAIISPQVRSEVIDATQFSDLAQHYQVFAVPKVVINDQTSFEGNLPVHQFLARMEQAIVGRTSSSDKSQE